MHGLAVDPVVKFLTRVIGSYRIIVLSSIRQLHIIDITISRFIPAMLAVYLREKPSQSLAQPKVRVYYHCCVDYIIIILLGVTHHRV